MMQAYREMLTYIKSAVTRNYSEKCINNIMDFISGSASQNSGLLQEFYQTTLKALEEAKNEVRGHLILFHTDFLVKKFKFWIYYSHAVLNFGEVLLVELPLYQWNSIVLCKKLILMLCRDSGLKQISSFVRFGLTWENMGEWIRYWAGSGFILQLPLNIYQDATYNILDTDFEGASQILSKRRWHRWPQERNPAFGGICDRDPNVHWDQK